MNRHRFTPALFVGALALLLSGCAMLDLPSYNTVRSESKAAMQRVMDELPPGVTVEPLADGKPFGCEGGGVFFTGRMAAFPSADFDAAAYIDGLPDALGDDFQQRDLGVKTSFPAVDFIATGYGNAAVGVTVVDDDGVTTVGVTATSRCAVPPE